MAIPEELALNAVTRLRNAMTDTNIDIKIHYDDDQTKKSKENNLPSIELDVISKK